jgi:hypothetical protein
MRKRNVTALVLVVLVSACTSTPAKTGYMGDLSKGHEDIQVLTTAPDRPFDAVGPVSGLLCHRNAWRTTPDSILKEAKELRIEAAKLGADAVIDAKCQKTDGMSFTANCFETYKCTGQAVRFKE